MTAGTGISSAWIGRDARGGSASCRLHRTCDLARRAGVDYRRLVEVSAEVNAVAKAIPGPAVVKNARALGR